MTPNKLYQIEMSDVLPVFFCTVEFLVTAVVNGRPLAAESADGKFLHFKAPTFKQVLTKNITVPEGQEPQRILKMYMQVFRDLGFIVSEDDRLTHIAWIGGKSMRVVTIRKGVYEALKAMENYSKTGKDNR